MKLARVGEVGREIPALIDADNIAYSLVGVIGDVDGSHLSPEVLAMLQKIDIKKLSIIEHPYRVGACVAAPSQVICVGLNYFEHAKESGMSVPSEPILFMKSPSSICGPNDNTILPRNSKKVDWEVELGIVIGSRCSYVDEKDARSYIAGFCLANDISDRGFQLEGTGQWVKGKSADTFGPVGPWLVTCDQVPNISNSDLWSKVNGEYMQAGHTSDMIFSIDFIVSYISQYMTLQPGDIILTGTPFGVGLGLNPPRYLSEGDIVELGIDGLGTQIQEMVPWKA
jgi:2-keto-4-pentenoate hydratase/2-oxohepta-3-ene-1,7-dioic acid hydratase in catechol pathway|tara:strand:+ start:2645 stop:3493 length:849 start_codon:yes stop_codon:yes gene_type:complete